MGPENNNREALLARAKEQERRHEWVEAANFYKQVLRSQSIPFAAETWEKLGFCYALASRQTENLGQFKKLRQLAVEAYKNAAEIFEKKKKSENRARSAQCNAIAEYTRSWLAPTPSEKKKALEECQTFGKEALETYENIGDKLHYGTACNNLLLCLFERLHVASDAREKQVISRKGIDCGNRAISVLSKLENKNELLFAYSIASLQSWYGANISDQEDKRKELASKSLSYSEKAVALSSQVSDPYYIAMSRWAAALSMLFFTENVESSLKHAKDMLQQGITVRDNYLRGIACYLLAFITDFMVPREVDPDKKKRRCEDIGKHAEEAMQYLRLVSQDFLIAETLSLHVGSYSSLAHDEVDVDTKRALLEKATEIGRKGLEHAVRSGSPDAAGSIHHALSKTLHFRCSVEPVKDEKAKLLGEALLHRKEYIKIVERSFPSNDWVLGVGKYYAGLLEAELSRLETSGTKKKALFKNAVSDMGDGVSLCGRWISSRPTPSYIAFVAEFEDSFGRVLYELYLLTEEKAILTRAIEVYSNAAEKFKKVDLPSRVAESFWKMARDEDLLGRHKEASKSFEDAFTQYKVAAQKIHQFAEFYKDYAVYMKAWSEIEKARDHHAEKQYGLAKEHYEKAAQLHESVERWNHLAQNYLALAKLEEAENLSRQEQTRKARDLFQQTAKLFKEARGSIKASIQKIQDIDHKEMAAELNNASAVREEYCSGRTALEEAKILDRQGNHTASSRKYGYAAEIFETIARKPWSKEGRRELQPIIYLCRAWQKMMMAETKASPILYNEAAKLFEQAKEHILDQQTSLLALANSSFCKALEAGTKFETTRDLTTYSTAKKYMEAASNYYLKAGFSTASEYAIATQRLFDGYIYMENANKETDLEKKARHYTIAEKVLQSSVESYLKAKHQEKAKQVRKFLDKVREERTLAASLSEVLHAPTIVSSTAGFTTPTPTHEKAVGLEKFEHASIQGHLTIPDEVGKEEDFEMQLDLVNVAKNSGLLIRIANLVPRGFSVTEVSPKYTLEKGSVDLGGKRFEPLKVETIKISARATDFGIFKVSPQVVYLDETGQFRTCRPKVVNVRVQPTTEKFTVIPRSRKYELVYKNLCEEHPKTPRNECRVAIAQIGASESGDVLGEFYEEKGTGLFGLRQDKVETVRSKVKHMIEMAHAKDVNILLFPELTIDLNYDKMLKDVVSLAKAYEMYIIPGSYHDQKTKRNISVVVGPDGILWRQEKHIPAIIHHEGKKFKEGIIVQTSRKTIVCNTEFGRIAIAICRDFLDMDLRVELKNFEPPVDIVFNPAFTPVTVDFRAAHFDARRSIYAYCFFANVAEFGDSFIYTPEKERVERTIPPKKENLIYKDVDLFRLRSERKKWEKEQKRFIQSTR